MARLIDYIIDSVRRPREQLSRGQHFVRHTCELTAHCYRELQRHRAEGMAAELTYRTIFSLIPVVVLGLVMFRVVGGLQEVQSQVENQLYSFFGVPEIPGDYAGGMLEATTSTANDADLDAGGPAFAAGTDPSNQTDDPFSQPGLATDGNPESAVDIPAVDIPAVDIDQAISVAERDAISVAERDAIAQAEVREESKRQARASIRKTLSEVTRKVATIDFKSIGVFGLLLFVYAAVALADSTEQIFNRIYDAPSQRPIHIRLAIHWAIFTLGSGLLAMSLYLSSQAVEWFVERFVDVGAGTDFRLVLNHALSVAASWVLLFLLYALMPNTHVSVKAAAAGSLVGSMLWEFAKFGFQIYVAKAVPYSAIYGSLGLIPLFLFWIYITWLIVLFGLIVTNTLQTVGRRDSRRLRWDDQSFPAADPDWMLPIMCEIGSSFDRGDSIDNQELADRIGIPARIVHEMTGRLVDEGMLRRVTVGAGEGESLVLARPSEKITVCEILTLAHRARPTTDHPAWQTMANLKKAECDAAGDKTLADISAVIDNA